MRIGVSWINRIEANHLWPFKWELRESDVGHCEMLSMGHRKTADTEATWLKTLRLGQPSRNRTSEITGGK